MPPYAFGRRPSDQDISFENFTLGGLLGSTRGGDEARIRKIHIIRAVAGRRINGFRTTRALFGGLACLVVLLVVGCAASEDSNPEVTQQQAETPARPNIIFILTDDLDAASAQQLPKLHSLLAEEGASFENSFATYPLCCPSRATILTGLYAHNDGVVVNDPPTGASRSSAKKTPLPFACKKRVTGPPCSASI